MAVQRIRFTISIDRDVYKQIEDFRFEERFNNMSRASEELLVRGLRSFYEEQNSITDQQPVVDISPEEAFGKED